MEHSHVRDLLTSNHKPNHQMSTAAAVQHIQLDSNQLSIANQIIEGMLSGWMETTLAGYAGCGKTVLASYIINELEKTYHKRVLTLCPTGKGANVLRTKGRKAETIHSAIYVFINGYRKNL